MYETKLYLFLQVSSVSCNFEKNEWCGTYVHQGGALISGQCTFTGAKPGMGLCACKDCHLQLDNCVLDGTGVDEYNTEMTRKFSCFNRKSTKGIFSTL